MEFKLNKIDMDVRQVINDSTKDGKIHTKKDLKVNKDKKEQNNANEQSKKHNLMQYDKKKKLIVNAVKMQSLQVDGVKETSENAKVSKGIFLDTKR